MAYRVILHRNAEKKYKRQGNKVKSRLNKAIEDLRTREDPRKGTHVRKLKGRLQGKYRYRVGDFRIIYEVYYQYLRISYLFRICDFSQKI